MRGDLAREQLNQRLHSFRIHGLVDVVAVPRRTAYVKLAYGGRLQKRPDHFRRHSTAGEDLDLRTGDASQTVEVGRGAAGENVIDLPNALECGDRGLGIR